LQLTGYDIFRFPLELRCTPSYLDAHKSSVDRLLNDSIPGGIDWNK
jgi:hypothetical protein